MSIEEALVELRKRADDFTKVGDAKEAQGKDKEGFLILYRRVLQYFNYISHSKDKTPDQLLEAYEIIGDISTNNPSLKEWTDLIIGDKNKEKEQVDLDEVYNAVGELFDEVDNMVGFDTNRVQLIIESLEHYKKVIQDHINEADEEEAEMILESIDIEINGLNRKKKELEGIASKMDF